jgi:hypothetical protein
MPFDQGAQQVECARADRHRSGFAALAYAEQAATAPVEQEIAEQESFRCRIGRVRSSPVKAVSPSIEAFRDFPPAQRACLQDHAGRLSAALPIIDETEFRVLRCLAWVATISVWKHEIEFGCEQVNHGFEVAD